MPKNRNLTHWLVLLCCCGLSASSIGLSVNCMGLFNPPVAESLGVGIGDVSMYLTIVNIISGLFGPVVVKALRRVDLRKMLAVGTLVSTACFAGMAYMTALWQMYLYALLAGISKAMISMVVIGVIIGNWFDKGMGIAMGLSMGASGIVAAILNPILNALVERAGWSAGYVLCAVLMLAFSLPAVIYVRLHPSEKGLPLYGRTEVEQPPERIADNGKKPKEKPVFSAKFFPVVATCIFCSAVTSMNSHLVPLASSTGLTSAIGATLVSMTMIGNTGSKLIMGVLCDWIGPKRACFLMITLAAAGLVGLSCAAILPVWLLMISALLLGAAFSLPGVGISTIERQVFGPKQFSTVYSYSTMATYISGALMTSVIGYVYDALGSYVPTTLVCAGLCALTALCLMMAYRGIPEKR